MGSISRSSRRPRRASVGAEVLESRSLLTGGAGSIFAMIPATVATAGQTVSVPITISPPLVQAARGKLLLGIDISPQQASKVAPKVVSVDNAQGHSVGRLTHGRYDRTLSRQLGGKTQTSAVLVSLNHLPTQPGGSAQFTVKVTGANQTTGSLELGFYLPGDVDGDGVVSKQDVSSVRAAMGAHYGSPKYKMDADANRDGRIDSTDLNDARRNLGAAVTVDPNITGGIDSSIFSDPQQRITNDSSVTLTGTATPGALITINQLEGKTATIKGTADPTGHFAIAVPLAPGGNSLEVTVADGFGQSNTGLLLPITYQPKS
jgi:hypothetical protein